MSSFTDALAAIERLRTDGIVDDYAIGGAMALVFWTEPIPTFDLDVFVLMRSSSSLVSLTPLYEWARRHGYPEEAEHIIIGGVPVQVIPAHNDLAEEAVREAANLSYEDLVVRVIRPEYLTRSTWSPLLVPRSVSNELQHCSTSLSSIAIV